MLVASGQINQFTLNLSSVKKPDYFPEWYVCFSEWKPRNRYPASLLYLGIERKRSSVFMLVRIRGVSDKILITRTYSVNHWLWMMSTWGSSQVKAIECFMHPEGLMFGYHLTERHSQGEQLNCTVNVYKHFHSRVSLNLTVAVPRFFKNLVKYETGEHLYAWVRAWRCLKLERITEVEMHFARRLCIEWEELVSSLAEGFWQALTCWKMMNPRSRWLDKPLQGDKNLRDLEIILIPFDKRQGNDGKCVEPMR